MELDLHHLRSLPVQVAWTDYSPPSPASAQVLMAVLRRADSEDYSYGIDGGPLDAKPATSQIDYAPVHAWRILATGIFADVVPLVIKLGLRNGEPYWPIQDIPKIIQEVGSGAIPHCEHALRTLALANEHIFLIDALCSGLAALGSAESGCRDEVVRVFGDALARFSSNYDTYNTILINTLHAMGATEKRHLSIQIINRYECDPLELDPQVIADFGDALTLE